MFFLALKNARLIKITPCQIPPSNKKVHLQGKFSIPLPLKAIRKSLEKGLSFLKFAYSQLNSTFVLNILFTD